MRSWGRAGTCLPMGWGGKKIKKANLERGFLQLPLEGYQGGSLCRSCWQGIPANWDSSWKKRIFEIVPTIMKMFKL